MLLTLILAVPILAALGILFFLKEEQRDYARFTAAGAMLFCLIASALVFVEMNLPQNIDLAKQAATLGQSFFIQRVDLPWIPALGISFKLGADGITAPMVFLTGLAGFCGVLISWRIEDRTRQFMAFFLLLVAGVYGVFVSLDLFLLFFWYELANPEVKQILIQRFELGGLTVRSPQSRVAVMPRERQAEFGLE
jgi:NADH-quinone oxidoreductase subunit M